MDGKKLFRLWLEYFPWRICQDNIKAPVGLHDVVEHVAPVEWRLGVDVGTLNASFSGFAQVFLFVVPSRLFILHAEGVKLVAQ